ncbi:MAG: selenocysteine-specific translation elongation factor [Chloroflexota bacterium]
MGVVVGTAGHIDHGKTTLLRALTGIDADRLPEERRRGMTIDVGYAHMTLPDGAVLDFVDVPGHDRLVGNMLVGAGEIDAALVVIAADDGPNAQTLEHLELLDALGIDLGVVAVTKIDIVEPDRAADVVAEVWALLSRTRLVEAPVLPVSGVTGEGIGALRDALAHLRAQVIARGGGAGSGGAAGRPRLAIDRVFAVKGRGTVVTGSLRGGPVAAGASLRLVPGADEVRVREIQERGATVVSAEGGRTALLLGGIEAGALRRGQVLTTDPSVVATSRVLVLVRPAAGLAAGSRSSVPGDRDRLRLHAGTESAAVLVIRGPREALELVDGSSLALLRLDSEIAVAAGDRFALRRTSPGGCAGGGLVLDAAPPRGVSRRRLTAARAEVLAAAVAARDEAAVAVARLELHGALRVDGAWTLAPDVEASLTLAARELVSAHHAAEPDSPGLGLPTLRTELALAARRRVTVGRSGADEVARGVVERLIAAGVVARDGDRVRDPARAGGLPPVVLAAMDRLEAILSVAAPPSLSEAARVAGCPPDGVRALETAGRMVRLEDDMAWAATTYRELSRRALSMAASGPLTPAAFRDATGSSRKYVMVILEDLDRRGLLRRTDQGHVLGPKTIARLAARAAAAQEPPA